MQDAAIQAELFKKFAPQQPPAQPGPAPGPQEGQAPAGANVQDTTGSGGAQMGTGTAPQPGEQGFSGNAG